jgi:transcriptional regulator with XRE-family HTH domain
MTRTEALRKAKSWSQAEMGDYLGLHQSAVSRLETGDSQETGPVSRLLDQLEASVDPKAVASPDSERGS